MGNPCCLLHQQGLKEGKVVVETKGTWKAETLH